MYLDRKELRNAKRFIHAAVSGKLTTDNQNNNLKKDERMKSKFAITLFLTTIIFYHNIIGQVTNNTKTSIDSIIQAKMNETGIVGIGASIIIDKKVVWTNGYGYADKEKQDSTN